ncbi:MAG TPA: YceI family protein [Chryseosolibacter sp.]|nr:YceI family protein [Chryseosolibacter sp.]
MNRIMAIIIAGLSLAGTGLAPEGIWIVDAQSHLTIHGSTNVNNFSCKMQYCTGTDTLQYVECHSARELRFTRSLMTVPIRSFDCGAKPISKDFWKTLRSETHPNLQINFISLQNLTFRDKSNIKGVVDITLAGSTTRYTIGYQATINRNGDVLLKGAHTVNFADFGLAAPQKMKGLIKVKEGLRVEFNLVLKQI